MGLRGKLGLIFLLVSSLAILVLCVAVYTQAQSSRLDRTRSFANERIQLAAAAYDRDGVPVFGSKLDDPELPPPLRDAVLHGQRATFKTGSPNAKMWVAVGVKDGKILSIVQNYETNDESMIALRRALILGGIGTVALVALVSVILAGSLSKRIVALRTTCVRR